MEFYESHEWSGLRSTHGQLTENSKRCESPAGQEACQAGVLAPIDEPDVPFAAIHSTMFAVIFKTFEIYDTVPSDLGNISCKFIDRTFSSQSNPLTTEFWHQNSARGPFLEFLFLSTDKPTSRNLLMLIVALASREGGCRLSRNWATEHVGGLVERANVAIAMCRINSRWKEWEYYRYFSVSIETMLNWSNLERNGVVVVRIRPDVAQTPSIWS